MQNYIIFLAVCMQGPGGGCRITCPFGCIQGHGGGVELHVLLAVCMQGPGGGVESHANLWQIVLLMLALRIV